MTYRPDTIAGYVGNEQIKRNLEIALRAARVAGEAVDHILATGPAGTGKTTIARIIAHEIGSRLHIANGGSLKTVSALVSLLLSVKQGDVIFIDEIHGLPKTVETVLYTAMEDRVITVPVGETVITNLKIALPDFTVVGATNRAHKLTDAIRQRFTIKVRLSYYTPRELAEILLNTPEFDGNAYGALEVARRSRGTPRIALANYKQAINFARAQSNELTAEVAAAAMTSIGIDNLGLEPEHRDYLTALINMAQGGPRGFTAMCNFLNKEEGEVEDIEGWLFHQDLVQLTDDGRVATNNAYEHMKQFIPVKPRPVQREAVDLIGR